MDSDSLKSVLDLPPLFRSVFSFRYFNSLQSECFSICYHSDINMVVSAPTGSGKTVLFELCILRLLSRFVTEDMRFLQAKGTLKTVYIAPSKALVQEKLRDWNQKFGKWGISCLELTGDNDAYNVHNLHEADIILTTPEKFDAVTRYRIKDGGLSFFSDIALLFIDEVHLLNDPRGAALEAIVSRIKMLSRNPDLKLSPLAHVRHLAVSATVPNLEDLAEWLMVPPQGIRRFGEEMRPVKLTTRVLGYTPAKNDFLFEQRLQNFVFDILMQYSNRKSALVFCSTRKGAQELAQRLTHMAMTFGASGPFIQGKEQQERLREASLCCGDKQMQSYIPYGVGYHHGGLALKDRSLVEGLFLRGDIQVLCTTNTLAHGINLPAHTVVIKSTRNYNKEKGLYMEYDRSTLLQMCGRAGRPPFDDTGTVIIMTRKETVHLYENLLNGCEVVESQLLSCMTEHLTAEIVQLTISDITRAIEWVKCSYLYVRTKKDPGKYSVKKGITKEQIEKHIQEICVQKVNELSKHQLIWSDDDGFLLKPLEPGRLMTKYYLRFNTMKYIMQAPASCSLEDVLHIVCRAEEIAWIQLRRNEKKLLNDINIDKKGRLRFHILDKAKPKKRIQTTEEKIFVLINDFLTGDPLVHDLSMTQDMNSISSNGCRIAKCMKEYFIHKKSYTGAINATLLAKSLHQKLWDNSKYLLKQLHGIGMVTAKALQSMDIDSFDKLAEADPRKIEIVTGRKYPFGNQIKESLYSLPPKVEMEIKEIDNLKQGKVKVMITLIRLSGPVQSSKRHFADMVVGSEEDDLIHFHEKIRVDEFNSPYQATVILPPPVKGKLTIKADLIFEEYIGIDLHKKLVREKSGAYSIPRSCKQYFPSSEAKSDFQNLGQSGKDSSVPSFILIDEETPEDTEDKVATEAKDDGKIISGTTVFDHIRKKAKSFPALATSKTSHLPSSPLLNLTRKRSRDELLPEPHDDIVLIENSGDNIPKHSVLSPMSERSEKSKNVFNIKTDLDSLQSQGIEGEFSLDMKQRAQKEHLTEEMAFDLIRKKSKNFPVLNGLKVMDPDPFLAMEDSLYDGNQPHHTMSKEAHSHSLPWNSPIISNLDCLEKQNTSAATRRSSATSIRGILSFDISMVKNSGQFPVVKQEQKSSALKEEGNHEDTLRMAGKPAEVNPFLGFKSVFSFL
ncbi:hypothetical protein SAY86_015941 [Trapa natans]|uniref:DNA 3'-5' helicase n=1 Tax=Trapa natans TaxID=22666 RepID=A0AAN7LC40_TRANT|nr:hypothetical protein SAY86_015941 [Trapa natans]